MAEQLILFSSESENEGSSVEHIEPVVSCVAPAPVVRLLGPAVSYVAPAPVDGLGSAVSYVASASAPAVSFVALAPVDALLGCAMSNVGPAPVDGCSGTDTLSAPVHSSTCCGFNICYQW